MNTHPDILTMVATTMHLERIATAQQANLTNQARRLQRDQTRRPPVAARVAGLVTRRWSHIATRPTSAVRRPWWTVRTGPNADRLPETVTTCTASRGAVNLDAAIQRTHISTRNGERR